MGGRQSVVVVFFLTQPAICSMCRHPLLAHSQGHVAASHRSGRNGDTWVSPGPGISRMLSSACSSPPGPTARGDIIQH